VTAFPLPDVADCRTAFVFKFHENEGSDTIKICSDKLAHSTLYEANLNMAVCDDKLCAILQLKMYWDLAGNYIRFVTIPGKPLTKFDHKPFSSTDYQKLDQILADRNSMLRVLEKEDLVDKSVQVKATTVDAVTGATPETIRNAVVEGAVYSSFSLWHYVNDSIKDLIRDHTKSINTGDITSQMLNSKNYETQLFALKQFSHQDYYTHFEELLGIIKKSNPLIKAYIISKLPLPFEVMEQNRKLVALFPDLDGYSKSIMLNRITEDPKLTTTFLPLLMKLNSLDSRQKQQLLSAARKYRISGY
jgi:hypothetical protein